MSGAPEITVLMAVYNGADCVGEAIESILNQTYKNFEFLIVNDGSSDNSLSILRACESRDARIRILDLPANIGLTKALNKGIEAAQGRFIARQDADDVSLDTRLEKQYNFLMNNKNISLVGGNSIDLYPGGETSTWGTYDPETLQRVTFFKTPFPHSTAMMRTETLRALGGYDETFKTAQDMELWMRFAKAGPIGMIQEPLIRRGIGENAISRKRLWRQFYDGLRARLKHNSWPRKPLALYHALRALLIALLPPRVVKTLQRYCSKT